MSKLNGPKGIWTLQDVSPREGTELGQLRKMTETEEGVANTELWDRNTMGERGVAKKTGQKINRTGQLPGNQDKTEIKEEGFHQMHCSKNEGRQKSTRQLKREIADGKGGHSRTFFKNLR